MIYIALCMIASYLLGSVPTGYLFAKILRGIDIRDFGSGNVGATNVFRTVGKVPGIIVFVLDFMKGFVAAVFIPVFFKNLFFPYENVGAYIGILSGTAAIAGHIWTVFLNFKGGKGVATTAGVVAGLSPLVVIVCFCLWFFVMSVWKYVSLASIAAAVALPVVAVIAGKDFYFIVFCCVLCLLGAYSHRSNIKRLLSGNEAKIVKSSKIQKN
ncbi:MAG: glycerol-3-phosphate 1-O-acyltransferase PlsY [Candidatus Omnitrophota bacterium]